MREGRGWGRSSDQQSAVYIDRVDPLHASELIQFFGLEAASTMKIYAEDEEGFGQQLSPSGLRCALKKIVCRKNSELDTCLDEVRMMERLKDSEHIIRIYDTEVGEFIRSFAHDVPVGGCAILMLNVYPRGRVLVVSSSSPRGVKLVFPVVSSSSTLYL